tara:strand:- start:28630 stop:29616 length:987 start_codon:yes stop_codon:yes gene_type:complete
MKYLIIGSNSFSGSNFVNFLLSKNNIVRGVSRSKEINSVFLPYKKNKNIKNFKFYKIDLNKDLKKLINICDIFKPNFIINFSAQGMVAESWKSPLDWYNTNLIAQVKFHEKIRNKKYIKKYIHFTTPEVYGSTSNLINENFNFSPSTPYATSRAACDLHLMTFFKAYNFPVIFTRAANVYGAHQQMFRIVPKTFFSILNKSKFTLHGGGKSVRSFIHINDVCQATYQICLKGKIGHTYHISTDENIKIIDLVKKICKITNSQFKDIVSIGKDRMGKDQAYLLSNKKITKELNWNANISLDEGLQQTLDWVSTNLNVLSKEDLNYKHKV